MDARWRRWAIVTSPINSRISVSFYRSSEEIRLSISISELLAFLTKPEVVLALGGVGGRKVTSPIDSPIFGPLLTHNAKFGSISKRFDVINVFPLEHRLWLEFPVCEDFTHF